MGKSVARGWVYNSSTGKYEFKVYNASAVEKSVFDEDGNLHQLGTKLTASAAELNGVTADYANRAVTTVDGTVGHKACAVNGLTLITGGTGIADLTLAAPTPGARAVIRIGTLASGSVVVTCAAGVTLNGTNTIATFDAVNEALALVYKAANTWEIELNIGAVAIS